MNGIIGLLVLIVILAAGVLPVFWITGIFRGESGKENIKSVASIFA